jgi:ribosomal-protein-alanine N-acetyltransferase
MAGDAVSLAPLQRRHAELLAELYRANRRFLAPYSPLVDAGFYTAQGQRVRIDAVRRRSRADASYSYAIELGGALVGTLTISDVIRGGFQSAHLGYWVSRPVNGRGVATAAVATAVGLAFGELGLHRLQAATLVRNRASQRVLEKNEFERIGLARHYLRIAGRWQDHILFARVAP